MIWRVEMSHKGRILGIGPTDNTSDQRTPRQPLRSIPEAIRASFVPYIPATYAANPHEWDMTRSAPDRPRADGVPIEVSGKVLSESGTPVRNALLEVWSANHYGRYRHVEDLSNLQLDENHFGMGRVLTDDDGHYRFWAISPGAYLARPDIGRWRPKHIHVSVSGGSSRMITQMYFPDEPNNVSDPMAILMGNSFERNIGKPYGVDDLEVDEGYRFDIVVGGRNSTFFE
jgi:protocatechuate 3,4-dioxygenase beta subunit